MERILKIDVTALITDLDQNPLLLDGKTLSLADIAIISLNGNFDDEKIDYKEKNTPLDISTEDASLLKRLIGKIWNPLIVGRAVEIIESDIKIKE
jgi:hypothetical protein